MAIPERLRIMISSRCNDSIEFRGKRCTLSDVRRVLRASLEVVELFTAPLFEVWINEDTPPMEGSADFWEQCLTQVRRADIMLVLYNGNAGWAKERGEIGICHAELQTGYSVAPGKVYTIALPLVPIGSGAARARNLRFREYVSTLSAFRGEARTGEDILERCKEALREAVVGLATLGVREAHKGKAYIGPALDWTRLSFTDRRKAMVGTLQSALAERTGSHAGDRYVAVRVGQASVLFLCHAVPAAMGVPAAREMVGQPFLRDHEHVSLLAEYGGPVHVIACWQRVTEAQAMRLLGFPDATIVSPPFGVYVADRVQKIQLVFLAHCRDESATRHAVQRFFEWLAQSEESEHFARRAKDRSSIARTIAKTAETSSAAGRAGSSSTPSRRS